MRTAWLWSTAVTVTTHKAVQCYHCCTHHTCRCYLDHTISCTRPLYCQRCDAVTSNSERRAPWSGFRCTLAYVGTCICKPGLTNVRPLCCCVCSRLLSLRQGCPTDPFALALSAPVDWSAVKDTSVGFAELGGGYSGQCECRRKQKPLY